MSVQGTTRYDSPHRRPHGRGRWPAPCDGTSSCGPISNWYFVAVQGHGTDRHLEKCPQRGNGVNSPLGIAGALAVGLVVIPTTAVLFGAIRSAARGLRTVLRPRREV